MMPLRALVAFSTVVSLAGPAMACPWCNSDAGRQVRAQIFQADFALTAAALALPFPVLLAIVALIYFWPARQGAIHAGQR